MDLAAFVDGRAGLLVPISGTDPRTGDQYDHKAFLPNDLPDLTPELSQKTWEVVTEASLALGRLDQAGHQVPNPGLLRRPSIRREAVSTSALEGTFAPFQDVLEADIEEDASAESSPALREVLNYVRVAELAMDWVPERPISIGMLCELQRLLVQGTPGETQEAGRVREVQVVVGPQGRRVEDARYVPPPPGDQLRAGLDAWQTWLKRNDMNPVVAVALAHYQFEALHPFNDGNGRLGRLVVVLQLLQEAVLHHGLLTISPWLEQRRPEYQDQLLRVSQTGEFDPWVRFMATALRARAEAAISQVERLLGFDQVMRDLTRSYPLRGVAAAIAQHLIGRPFVAPSAAARLYDVSYQAANNAVSRLVQANVLREVTGRRYDRVFVAPDVLDILEG